MKVKHLVWKNHTSSFMILNTWCKLLFVVACWLWKMIQYIR